MEIENFISKPFYELEGQFKANDGTYKGKAKIKTENKNEIQEMVEKHQLDTTKQGYIQKVETNEKRKNLLNYFHFHFYSKKLVIHINIHLKKH